MKTKTMFKSAIAVVAALAISMLALVGCANTPENNPAIEATEGAESAEATNEQTEEATEAQNSDNGTEGATASDSGSNGAYTPSQGASDGNSGAKASGNSGGTQSAPKAQSTPSQPAHEHNFNIPITETRTVTDKAAWDEPVYGIVCSCGATFTDKASARSHISSTGHACGEAQINTIHHPAQTHTETVTIGYKCSCGATK